MNPRGGAGLCAGALAAVLLGLGAAFYADAASGHVDAVVEPEEFSAQVDAVVEPEEFSAQARPAHETSDAASSDGASTSLDTVASFLSDAPEVLPVLSSRGAVPAPAESSGVDSVAGYTTETPGVFETHSVRYTTRDVLSDEPLHPKELPVSVTVTILHTTETVLSDEPLHPKELPVSVTRAIYDYTRTMSSYVPIQLEQNILPDSIVEVVYDYTLDHQELVIETHLTDLEKIVVTEETDEPRINLKNLLDRAEDGEERTLVYPNDLAIDVVFENVTADLVIEDGTEMTGPPDWDGVIHLPVFEDPSLVDLDGSVATSVLSVGLDEETVEFDAPVRIAFHNRAGQDAFFSRGSEMTPIDTACSEDDAGTVSSELGGEGECRVDLGRDLVVWTFHFTEFVTAEPAAEAPTDPAPGTPEPGDQAPAPGNPASPDDDTPAGGTPEVPAPRETPRQQFGSPSRGGGGGGGGGGGSGGASYSSDLGISAVLEFSSGGKGVLGGTKEIRLEPGEDLTIRPRVVPADQNAGILQMRVGFQDMSGRDAAWVLYEGIPGLLAAGCDAAVEEYRNIRSCDVAGMVGGVPSFEARNDGIRDAFESLTIPLEGEFSGRMTVSLRDRSGLELIPPNDATYRISISAPRDAEPAIEPPAKEPEPAKPEPERGPEPAPESEPTFRPRAEPEPAPEPEPVPAPRDDPEPKPEREQAPAGIPTTGLGSLPEDARDPAEERFGVIAVRIWNFVMDLFGMVPI